MIVTLSHIWQLVEQFATGVREQTITFQIISIQVDLIYTLGRLKKSN